jgi:DHA2 family multidrug resistance protein
MATEDRASLADWLAVGAGTLGALIALMDVSIVNASLPTIQGEIGATSSEATWIGTAYLVAEIIVMPLTGWLERLLGMRRMLLGGASLFVLFSMLCGLSTDLNTMILGRVGQGLAGAVLIPTGMTLISQRLPPRQQTLGLGLFVFAALLGPAAGPLLGGWLTEHVSWHYAFFVNVPICAGQLAMLTFALPKTKGDWHEFGRADWFGIIGMAAGLGGLTTLLEEGHREQWFDSVLIWRLTALSLFGFLMIALGQIGPRRPIIKLALLRDRNVASAIGLMVMVGMTIYGSLFTTPQFLASVAGYNAQQAGLVTFSSGLAALPVVLLYPLAVTRMDSRLIVALGVLFLSTANYLTSHLTAQSVGSEFYAMQILLGMGTSLMGLPLQQQVTASVSADDMTEANSLFVIARNVGGSIVLSAIASFQDQRFDLHRWQIHASLGANDPDLQSQLGQAAAAAGPGPEGMDAVLRGLDGQISIDALVMCFNDMFLAMVLVGAIVAPLILLLRPLPRDSALPPMGH